MQKNTSIELFAGAGGLALGLEEAGFEGLAFVEFNRAACDSLRLNRPQWNVIEDDVLHVFESLGYRVQHQVLNAAYFGVGQKRERLITIGVRHDLVEDIHFTYPTPDENWTTLREALADVPESIYQPYSEKKRAVMELVPPGGCWVDLPDNIAREYMGKSYFSGGGRRGMARRISWDEPCLTLTTSPSQKQTERCHPEETRPFTVREYARIQSFPDSWQFAGSIGDQYKQIGNAVPVELARRIGAELIAALRAH